MINVEPMLSSRMPERLTRRSERSSEAPIAKPVRVQIVDTPRALEAAKGTLAPGLAYGKNLQDLWDPAADPERFVYRGILAVGLAWVENRIAGWGELLVARPLYGEAAPGSAFCRVSRLDVGTNYRRRRFADARSGQPLSVLLLNSLIKAAPWGSEVVAEVTPDAENLFEQVGFKLRDSGRWLYVS